MKIECPFCHKTVSVNDTSPPRATRATLQVEIHEYQAFVYDGDPDVIKERYVMTVECPGSDAYVVKWEGSK